MLGCSLLSRRCLCCRLCRCLLSRKLTSHSPLNCCLLSYELLRCCLLSRRRLLGGRLLSCSLLGCKLTSWA